MNRMDQLGANYRTHIQLPLGKRLPASQRVWFAVYPPEDERAIGKGVEEFEIATREAGKAWLRIDLRGQFAAWTSSVDEDERAGWWRNPAAIDLYAKDEWKKLLAGYVREQMATAAEPDRTVFALTGLVELYDFLHVSELIEALGQSFPGFLLVLFPGVKEGNTYRFLDARTGWNYLAVPILAEK